MAEALVAKLLLMMVVMIPTAAAQTAGAAVGGVAAGVTGSWCVARSDATDEALQRGLDYACWAGADCGPIQANGLCFLPNTMAAHASYAFNSFFQRKSMAPGSCDFSGTATVAKSDPSYGSCVYPASLSSAGGPLTPGTATGLGNPGTNSTPTGPIFGSAGSNPSLGPMTDDSAATSEQSKVVYLVSAPLLLVLSLNLQALFP